MVVAFIIIEKKLFNGKPILQCGIAPFLFILVALTCTIGLVSGIETKGGVVLSIFSFTNGYGYGFMLIFFLNLVFYYNAVE